MNFGFSIREKLLLFYVVLVCIAVFVLGYYSYNSSHKAITNRTFEQLTAIRELKHNRLEHFFLDRMSDVNLFIKAQNLENIDVSNFKNTPLHTLDYYNKLGYYKSICIATHNSEFIPIYSSKDSACSSEILKRYKEINSIEILDLSNKDVGFKVFIVSPFKNKNNKNYIIFELSLSAINTIMLEKNSLGGFGQSGETYLVGNDYRMRSSSRFQLKSEMQVLVKTNSVIEAFKNKTGTNVIKDYRNINVLSSYTSINISKLHWAIIAEIDEKEVMTPLYKIRMDIFWICTLIIAILSVFAFIISRRIIKPLLRLRDIALEIAKGKYGKTIEITSNDEVGELSKAFNHMSIQILEQTKDLREREKRLQHFYQATTDGIILHDRGSIIIVNQAVSNLTSYSNKELINLDVSKLIILQDYSRIKRFPDRHYLYESECITKDGKKIPVELIETSIEYDRKAIGAIVIRDITERIEIHNKLEEERNKRVTSFIDGQEDERKRLSRELHDGLGQSLVGIKLRLELLKLNQDTKNEDTLNSIKTFVNQTIEEVRRMSNNLTPSVLRDIGLKLAIEKLCNETQNDTGIQINVDIDTIKEVSDERIKSNVYRIIQEAIHNAVKHSKATEMSIMMIQEKLNLRIIIEDNGIGFDEEKLEKRGKGLYSLHERVVILHGNLSITSAPGKGVVINVKIPLNI